ncbi:hypothetical protein BDN72DRAFT_186830 [Pluteus cervinus]|uniref:Uncharacterized protein n=1 Tax=Pluteus cervinus TaxID=181527 RepID=A0ACD3B7C3_9AGAR|nr:hypothetical protein BDN72DRAFT_186830 [Pluteus cervinus]
MLERTLVSAKMLKTKPRVKKKAPQAASRSNIMGLHGAPPPPAHVITRSARTHHRSQSAAHCHQQCLDVLSSIVPYRPHR